MAKHAATENHLVCPPHHRHPVGTELCVSGVDPLSIVYRTVLDESPLPCFTGTPSSTSSAAVAEELLPDVVRSTEAEADLIAERAGDGDCVSVVGGRDSDDGT